MDGLLHEWPSIEGKEQYVPFYCDKNRPVIGGALCGFGRAITGIEEGTPLTGIALTLKPHREKAGDTGNGCLAYLKPRTTLLLGELTLLRKKDNWY